MRLAAIFSDHMVLQRDKEIRVFGESEKKTVINITIDNTSLEKEVAAGEFVISLPAHPAGGPYTMTVTDTSDPGSTKEIRDVYYGEVWIDNGQSNMEFEIQNARGGAEELSSADLPLIRYFKCIKTPVIDDDVLLAEQNQSWTPLTDGRFRDMSGVAYFFAKKLHGDLSVPVGMVDCCQGGSSISCWLDEERLSAHPEGRVYIDAFEKAIEGQTQEDYDRNLRTYNRMVEDYKEKARTAKVKNPYITSEELSAVAGDFPWPPPMGLESTFRPGGLYHTMLERIMPYTARGILYYQGEEDSEKASGYSALLRELIDEFRAGFSEDDLPVVILQLPMFLERNKEDKREWAHLREAQAKTVAETDGTYLIPLIDLGEYDNVHPEDKKTPGERTETEVLYEIYKDKNAGAPHAEFDYAENINKGVLLHFRNTLGKLILKDNELIDLRNETKNAVDHIYGFEVRLAGEENYIVPEAEIKGDTVLLSVADPRGTMPMSADVPKDTELLSSACNIEEIRYGFFNYGKVNLCNSAGLPVAPFRSYLSPHSL